MHFAGGLKCRFPFAKAACGLFPDYFSVVVTWAEPAVTEMKAESSSFLLYLK